MSKDRKKTEKLNEDRKQTEELNQEEISAAQNAAKAEAITEAAAAREGTAKKDQSKTLKIPDPSEWPVQIVRHVIQVISFLLFPMLFMTIFNGIVRIITSVASGTFSLAGSAPDLIIVGGVLLITALWGRFFCGWLCSIGAVSDLIYSLSDKITPDRPEISESTDKKLKVMKYIVLAVIIVAAFLSAFRLPLLGGLSGQSGLLEGLSGQSGLLEGLRIPLLSDFLNGSSGHFAGLWPFIGGHSAGHAMRSGAAGAIISTLSVLFYLLLIGVIAGSVFVKRFFCRYLCPLGAIFTPLSSKRLFRIKKNEEACSNCGLRNESVCSNCGPGNESACTNCGLSNAHCSMGIDVLKDEYVKSGECTNCMECISSCDQDCLTASSTPAVAGTCACLAIAGLVAAGGIAPGNRFAGKGSTGDHKNRYNIGDNSRGKDFRNGRMPGDGQNGNRGGQYGGRDNQNGSMPGNGDQNGNGRMPSNGNSNDNDQMPGSGNQNGNDQYGHRHGNGNSDNSQKNPDTKNGNTDKNQQNPDTKNGNSKSNQQNYQSQNHYV